MSGAQAEAPASVARAAVEEKEARAAAEQVVGAAAKRLASRTTVLGMGSGTRDPAGAVGGSGSAHVLLADALTFWDECTVSYSCRVGSLSRLHIAGCLTIAAG